VTSIELGFCCNSGSNRKTQPYYWLATDQNNSDQTKKQRMTEGKRKTKERTNKERLGTLKDRLTI
jgi:hypothetical protein